MNFSLQGQLAHWDSNNLLIDAYGQKRQLNKAESIYMTLLEVRCVPTEDTYALLLRAY
jgi:pentatricopeptide repeat protein